MHFEHYDSILAPPIRQDNNLYIQDLNSTNGVYVNEERIKDKVKLTAGDEIKIGSAIFKVLKPGKQ